LDKSRDTKRAKDDKGREKTKMRLENCEPLLKRTIKSPEEKGCQRETVLNTTKVIGQ